jgi:hypothetical protein
MKKLKLLFLTALAGVALATSAQAQNPNFAPGDVYMFFQKFGDPDTFMVNLGAGFSYRDATTSTFDIKNVGTELTTAFGANWFEDSDVYFGLAGVFSSSINITSQTNGDPRRTIYVSRGRTSVGTVGTAGSLTWEGFGDGDMTLGSNGIIQVGGRLETVGTTDRLAEPTSSSFIDDRNPFLGSNPGTAFGIFPGGVQYKFGSGSFGNFGGVNAEGVLDLYRILASTSAPGQVDGPLRTGTYEGSFAIDNLGNVSFIAPVPEPSTSAALIGIAALFSGCLRRRKAA